MTLLPTTVLILLLAFGRGKQNSTEDAPANSTANASANISANSTANSTANATANATVEVWDPRFKSLKFGDLAEDYVAFKPDVTPLQEEFSICAWVKKLRTSDVPCWLSYSQAVNAFNDILISVDGFHNQVLDSSVDLKNEFSDRTSKGLWYHYCVTTSNTTTVYLNGEEVASQEVGEGKTLNPGGSLILGNYKVSSKNAFGGQLYKLNIFNTTLNSSAVKEMSRCICCSVEEDDYDDVRYIKWEEILTRHRNGDVTEVAVRCNVTALREQILQTEQQLKEKTIIMIATSTVAGIFFITTVLFFMYAFCCVPE